MNAKEAKELTERSLRDSVVKPYLDIVFKEVQKQAKRGRSSWVIRFENAPQVHVKNELFKQLKMLGYNIDHYSGDIRDPRDGATDTLKW